ncbi:MAG: carbohydrate ABC transporter permease [Lachnospiraceae bacterium]|jgi:putative aldouronate transport system permease protein
MNKEEKAAQRAAVRAGKGKRFHAFRSESTGEKIGTILLYFFMTLIVLIVLLPVLNIIACSFSAPQAVISGKVGLWPVDPTLRGYEAVFNYKKFWIGLRNSIFYTVVGTFVNIVMTVLCAYPLSRKEFTARNKISMYFVFTMYFSGGLVPTFLVITKLGLVDTIWAMIIPVAMSSYNMIICRTYMVNSIPDELYEAAELDGCTPFQYMIRVVVPLCKPILAVLVLYYAVGHWNSYQDAMFYLKSEQLMPLQIILREILIMSDVDVTMMGSADALARQRGLKDLLQYSLIVVSSLPVMIIYPFVQKYFVKGVMIGAVKG